MIKLAINGFGRIGRAAFKVALENPKIDVVAINDLGNIESLAYLLRYDTVYGRYDKEVTVTKKELKVDGKKIKVLAEKDPGMLPWKDLGIDVVIESTGVFTKKEDAEQHIEAGAKKVLISAPSKSEEVQTIVRGVNQASEGNVYSNASCTTNCAAPVAAVMDNEFEVESALLTTVHAYTSTQSIVDGPDKKDFRKGRAAAQNIIPTSTGAALAAAKAYTPLKEKFDGVSLRVPVPVVSMADFVFLVKEELAPEEVNSAFKKAASEIDVLSVTEEPNVSSDFIGNPNSAIVDLNMTRVVGRLVKVMAWYDNEWGYSNRLVEQVVQLGS